MRAEALHIWFWKLCLCHDNLPMHVFLLKIKEYPSALALILPCLQWQLNTGSDCLGRLWSPLLQRFSRTDKHLPKLLPRSEAAWGWGDGLGRLPKSLPSLLSVSPDIQDPPFYTRGYLWFWGAFLFNHFCILPGTPFHNLSLQLFKNRNISLNSFLTLF